MASIQSFLICIAGQRAPIGVASLQDATKLKQNLAAYSLSCLGRSNFGFGAAVKPGFVQTGNAAISERRDILRKEPRDLGAKDSARVRM
jgi:hypothetical protein